MRMDSVDAVDGFLVFFRNGAKFDDVIMIRRKLVSVFGGSSNTLERTGNRRFVIVMVYPERTEVHILVAEQAFRLKQK